MQLSMDKSIQDMEKSSIVMWVFLGAANLACGLLMMALLFM